MKLVTCIFCLPLPPSPSTSIKTNDVVYTIIEAEDVISDYFDLTSRFPQCWIRGNQYLIVGYYYNANSILGAPIKNHIAISNVNAWKELQKNMNWLELHPTPMY